MGGTAAVGVCLALSRLWADPEGAGDVGRECLRAIGDVEFKRAGRRWAGELATRARRAAFLSGERRAIEALGASEKPLTEYCRGRPDRQIEGQMPSLPSCAPSLARLRGQLSCLDLPFRKQS